MKKQLAALIIALAAATPALAAPATYTVDTTHTFPRFSYSHFGYSTQLSRLTAPAARLCSTLRPKPVR